MDEVLQRYAAGRSTGKSKTRDAERVAQSWLTSYGGPPPNSGKANIIDDIKSSNPALPSTDQNAVSELIQKLVDASPSLGNLSTEDLAAKRELFLSRYKSPKTRQTYRAALQALDSWAERAGDMLLDLKPRLQVRASATPKVPSQTDVATILGAVKGDLKAACIAVIEHGFRVGALPMSAQHLIAEAYSIHDLRHYFAINHYQQHKDIYALKHLLGHASIQVTEHYLKGMQAYI